MQQKRTITPRTGWIVPGLAALLSLFPAALRAEDFIDWGREPILPSNLSFDPDPGANSRPNRIRLFRITPGFLSDPVGLSDVDDPLSSAASDPNPTPTADATTDWLTVTMGNDNPFFDLRRPGDPGGVGYYKVHGQVQLLDSPNTGCTVALQAVTPAGARTTAWTTARPCSVRNSPCSSPSTTAPPFKGSSANT